MFSKVRNLIKNKKDELTEEELIQAVADGQESGVLLAQEAEMVQNVLEFDETDVKDIMVHRKNIVFMDASLTLKEAIHFVNENHFSRYPVYLEDTNNIVGSFHIKDAFVAFEDLSNLDKPINEIDGLIKKAEFVTETHSINTLFAKMQQKKNHMVLVVDEYGQVSGLMTMEDIIEEIVGEIEDEHDEEDDTIERVADGLYMMEGATTLDEAEEILGVRLSEDFETLNGYLTALHGRIPDANDLFSLDDGSFSYEVRSVKGKVIGDVAVKRLKAGV